jgi:hypothetical protein
MGRKDSCIVTIHNNIFTAENDDDACVASLVSFWRYCWDEFQIDNPRFCALSISKCNIAHVGPRGSNWACFHGVPPAKEQVLLDIDAIGRIQVYPESILDIKTNLGNYFISNILGRRLFGICMHFTDDEKNSLKKDEDE